MMDREASRAHETVLQIFFASVMLWTLMKSALLLPLSSRVWEDAHFETLDHSGSYVAVASAARELIGFSHHSVAMFLISIQFASWFITQVSSKLSYLMGTLVFSASSLLVFESIGPTLDGGDNLASIFLALLPLSALARLKLLRSTVQDRQLSPSDALSSALILVIRFQVAAMYAFAGACKLVGHEWQNGTALFYILQADLYSLPLAKAMALNYPLITVAATYGTIAFQVAFPLLIWVRRTRPFLIAAGIALHLSIIVAMGLFEFGLIMMISYLIWLDAPDLESAERGFRRQRHRINQVRGFLIASLRGGGAKA